MFSSVKLCSLVIAFAVIRLKSLSLAHNCSDWTTITLMNGNKSNCYYHTNRTLHCFGNFENPDNTMSQMDSHITEELHICDLANGTFDPQLLMPQFPLLKHLHIEERSYNLKIIHNFPPLQYLEVINISRTGIALLAHSKLFEQLPALKIVDLRWNNLDNIELPFKFADTSEPAIYLAGNPWNCTRSMNWMLADRQTADAHHMQCTDQKYRGRPFMSVMQFQETLRNECRNFELRHCVCDISYILPYGATFMPLITVDCSHLDLLQLPNYLPTHTISLRASHNRIVSVEPLRSNVRYQKLTDIYLDYNAITSIDILESGEWIENFRVFNLKGNRLVSLPIHALDNAFERNRFISQFYLSGNPWPCDCGFTPKFKEFLSKYSAVIQEGGNITCTYNEPNDHRTIPVLALSPADLCKIVNDVFQFIDLINCVLAALIVFILGKLAYDYYFYKKYGKLPWIVTTMP